MSYVPVKFTRNAFSSRDLTSSEDSSCMRSRGGMRPRPPGVFFECTCTFKVQPAGVHLKKVGNCVVAIAQARKTKPLSVALMPCGAPAAAAVLLRLPSPGGSRRHDDTRGADKLQAETLEVSVHVGHSAHCRQQLVPQFCAMLSPLTPNCQTLRLSLWNIWLCPDRFRALTCAQTALERPEFLEKTLELFCYSASRRSL